MKKPVDSHLPKPACLTVRRRIVSPVPAGVRRRKKHLPVKLAAEF